MVITIAVSIKWTIHYYYYTAKVAASPSHKGSRIERILHFNCDSIFIPQNVLITNANKISTNSRPVWQQFSRIRKWGWLSCKFTTIYSILMPILLFLFHFSASKLTESIINKNSEFNESALFLKPNLKQLDELAIFH